MGSHCSTPCFADQPTHTHPHRPAVLVPGRGRRPPALGTGAGARVLGGAYSSPGGGCQAPSPSPSTGTRSPGAADLSGRDVSVLDADSQAGDEDALDFFQQQDRVEDEGLPTLGQQDGDGGKSSEDEEEALDPLGIMRYVSPSGWVPPPPLSGLL